MPEPLTVGRAGLMTAQETPVPLSGVSIEAEISAFCARVTVTQRYVNREDTPLEAVYLFPLDEGAAVCGFEAIVDGTLVVGEVHERDKAFEMYDRAMERGDGAFLLDEERPDVFQASVGNLPPGKDVLLKLTYVTELTVDGTALRFAIPTTVAPRYAPAEDQRGLGRPDSEALSAPTAWRVPYGLNLTLRLAMSGSITRVESPSHPIAVSVSGSAATVSLSQHDAALDRDFVLSVEATGLDTPQAWIERGEHGDAIAVAFVPALAGEPVASEVVFLVDRSGSMEGASIQEVRSALQLCLRSLSQGCRFNIVGFGSTTAALFEESRAYDDESLTQASRYVAGLQADLGGTEILPALARVLSASRHAELTRQVVVLTDGEVTNTDAVLALARTDQSSARIFTFGIGAGASHHLVKGLARAGGGAAEFIHPGERIEPKVLRQFGRLLSPALTNVRVDWGGLKVTQAPTSLPPVFAGSRLLLYAFADGPISEPTSVQLNGHSPSRPVRFDVAIDPARVVSGSIVTTLAARARIRELEESPEWTTTRGSRQRERKVSPVTQEIVLLAKRHGLMSRETSYVAIERRETPVAGDVQLRRVPIALTTGWGGLDRHRPMQAPASVHAGYLSPLDDVDTVASGRIIAGGPVDALSVGGAAFRVEPSTRSTALGHFRRRFATRASSPMLKLVALQHADGSWDLTEAFAEAIGRPLTELEDTVDGAGRDPREARRAWATALAVAWLIEYAREAEDEWRMLAGKATRWLASVGARPRGGGDSIEHAREYLRTA